MAKRANGQGAVYLRGDGRWEAQLRFAGGGRKSVYGRTRREVLGKLREARWAAARGLPVSSRNPTLAVFLDRWLEVIRDRVRTSTYENYELNARRLTADLGSVPLARLNPPAIQAAYQRLLRRGLTAYSVLQAHRVLHRALTQAFQWGLASRNPAALVFPPRPRRREMTALSTDQLIVLLAATRNDRLHVLWVLLATAGLRVGEALGLKWEDLDLDARRLAVKRALQHRRGVGLVFVEPKTPRSRRAVPLTSIAVEALRDHRDRQMGHPLPWEDSGLVFTNFSGRPMQPNTANSELKRALNGAGLPQIRVHDLRHTTATVLLETGTHPKVVQDLLGHKTVVTTLDTYSHVLPALHGDAISRLEALFAARFPCLPQRRELIVRS